MSDRKIIYLDDAIDALKKKQAYYAHEDGAAIFYEYNHAIKALENLPSAQPDVPDKNVGDMISRQAAIDALIRKRQPVDNNDGTMTITMLTDNVIKDVLKALPSTQSEIIRCKDCAHRSGDYCHRFHDGYSAFIHHEDYCNYAERRTDE